MLNPKSKRTPARRPASLVFAYNALGRTLLWPKPTFLCAFPDRSSGVRFWILDFRFWIVVPEIVNPKSRAATPHSGEIAVWEPALEKKRDSVIIKTASPCRVR